MERNELEYAGFWVRLGATLIDASLLFAATMPLLVWIYGWGYYHDGKVIAGPADFVISWLAPAVATVLFWRYREATPGKMALSLRVVNAETGEALGVVQAVARYIVYFLSALPLCLGFIWIAFDRRKQGWHDHIAKSVVVRAKDRGPDAVRFDGDSTQPREQTTGRAQSRNSGAFWIVLAGIAAVSMLAVAWAFSAYEVRWIPYQTTGLLTEYRLMQVPVHQPYPPGTVCYGGYLERVNMQAHTTHRVKDDHGKPVPCLP